MKQPPFELPMDDFLPGKFSLGKAGLPRALAGSILEPLDLEPDLTDEECQNTSDVMGVTLMMLNQSDKTRVFLDAFKDLERSSRLRKDVFRELARITNRSDKEFQALPDEEKARLFGRYSYKMDERFAALVLAGAMTQNYFDITKRLIERVATDPSKAEEYFKEVQDQMPLNLWPFVLVMAGRDLKLSPGQQEASKAVMKVVPEGRRASLLPFTVADKLPLNPLEQHLLELHRQDPVKAKPLITALGRMNPARAENWLLFALTDCPEPAPSSPAECAWHLAGHLYLWGNNPQTADIPFDPESLKQNADAIRLLFSSPQLAAARELVGEFLIRQLVEAREDELWFEVLPQDLFRRHEERLRPVIEIVARRLAADKKGAKLKEIAERFPFLKLTSVLPLALRRSGEFEAAKAELRDSTPRGKVERALIEARIADAFELELPEDPEKQREFAARLEPIQDVADGLEPETLFCAALHAMLNPDRDDAEMAFTDLQRLPLSEAKRKACQLLLALQAQNSELIQQTIDGLEIGHAEEMLAFIPGNLLRGAIRALALVSDSTAVKNLAALLYQHLPEALDPLLSNEEMLANNPFLIKRLLDRNEGVEDPIQRWAGCQRALDLAAPLHDQELMARAIDGCLAIKDPLLAPHQVRLLRQRIPQCEDLDLRELLIERLAELSPEEAKPFLYQLLHTYMGNQRPQDAWRIAETLRELGESSADLDQCVRVLQPLCQAAGSGHANAKSDRLPRPVSVGFYGGDSSHKARTDQLRAELMRKYSGLAVEFDHTVWNPNNLGSLVQSVAKFDVIVASNLMRTGVSHAIRQRARDLNKTWGYCRNQGLATITKSILDAVQLHLVRK